MLAVSDLRVCFETTDGPAEAVRGVSFELAAGETLAIVGESGSGKSQLAFATLGLLARNGAATGSVRLEGREILNLPERALNAVRAKEIGIVFQDPMTSLNPYMKIGAQMAEVLVLHQGLSKRAAWAESARMLDAVQIPEAKARLQAYPHECSGGMRQRIMVAMALLCQPRILIADEPTTALDVTVQAQIVRLLEDIRSDFGTAILLITHDLGLVAGTADRVMVMYGGRVMEMAAAEALFAEPSHPYTQGLLQAVPRLDVAQEHLQTIPGEPPDLALLGAGCPFAPRCGSAEPRCLETMPDLTGAAHMRACHLPPEAAL